MWYVKKKNVVCNCDISIKVSAVYKRNWKKKNRKKM